MTTDTVTLDDVRLLAAANSLCLTVAMAIPTPAEMRTRVDKILREVDKRLQEANVSSDAASDLKAPITDLALNAEDQGMWATEFLMFRSPGLFRHFATRRPFREFVSVGDRFQIRPLLPLLSTPQSFYLLALSQKHVRLFFLTQRRAQEISLKGFAHQSLQVWMNTRMPDHDLENRATLPHPVGTMKGVVFGTSTDREREKEYLHHFFKQIDKGVHKIIGTETLPLLLAGIETEVAIYRRVSTYPHLSERALAGSPDGMATTELFERAHAIMSEAFAPQLQKVLDEFPTHRDANQVLFSIDSILRAAYEGRVATLLLQEDAEHVGVWEYTPAVGSQGSAPAKPPPAQDLLNLAALETLVHRGQAFALKVAQMPDRSESAALLRY